MTNADQGIITQAQTAARMPYRVRPWLIGELGWYRANAEANLLFSDVQQEDDSFGINVGGGLDVAVTELVSLGVDIRYHNAFNALNGLEFVTTMLNVGLHFGE